MRMFLISLRDDLGTTRVCWLLSTRARGIWLLIESNGEVKTPLHFMARCECDFLHPRDWQSPCCARCVRRLYTPPLAQPVTLLLSCAVGMTTCPATAMRFRTSRAHIKLQSVVVSLHRSTKVPHQRLRLLRPS